MKHSAKEVYKVFIFDEFGKLSLILGTLKEINLYHTKKGIFFKIKNALLDIKILSETKVNNKTDNNISINNNTLIGKKCKIIAKILLENIKISEDYECILEIPKAEITDNYDFLCNNEEPSAYDLYFKLNNFDDLGNYCKLKLYI